MHVLNARKLSDREQSNNMKGTNGLRVEGKGLNGLATVTSVGLNICLTITYLELIKGYSG